MLGISLGYGVGYAYRKEPGGWRWVYGWTAPLSRVLCPLATGRRSAELAIRGAKRFSVPGDNTVFEANFRRFYFLFRPEDLLR